MRQFIYATDFESDATGASGKLAIKEVADGSNVGLNLVLQRTAAEGGDILYPIYPKDFTWNVAPGDGKNFKSNKTFEASFTIDAVEKDLEYSVIFVKKGKQFNERSNWSFDVRSTANDTVTTIGDKIAKFVNDNSQTLGLTAENAAGKVTVRGVKVGEDFAIKLGGELFSKNPVEPTEIGAPAFMDAAMVKDLAAKCAADAGFEYPYESEDLYPGYPLNIPDGQYKVYTLRFTEPRVMGTREEAVYQIIQIAFPADDATNLGTEADVLSDTVKTFAAYLNEYVVDVR